MAEANTNGTSASAANPTSSDSSKPIIITKSISSLTSNATSPDAGAKPTPITLDKDQKNQENVTGDDKSTESTDKPQTPSDNEKLEARVKKFGVQSDNVKKNMRAQRFGVSASASVSDGNVSEKLQSRAQRFGTTPSTPTSTSNGDAKNGEGPNKEVLEKRAQRFGAVAADEPKAASTDSDPVLLKRKERFGVVDEDAKKKLRGQRFENST